MGNQLDKFDFDPMVQFAAENLTVDNTSGGVIFTVATYVNGPVVATTKHTAKLAVCTVETAPIRITENANTTVTTSVGTLYNVGDQFQVYGAENLANFRAIRTTGTSATLDVEYYF